MSSPLRWIWVPSLFIAIGAPLLVSAQARNVVTPAPARRVASGPLSATRTIAATGVARGVRSNRASTSQRRTAGADTPLLAETFADSATTPNAWVSGLNACITAGNSSAVPTPSTSVPACGANAPQDPTGLGALELTAPVNRASGYVFYAAPIGTANGLSVTFDYFSFATAGIAGDGLALVLADASQPLPTRIGGCCSSLGYADYDKQPALANGYLGVGLDETGYYTSSFNNKTGGLSGLLPNVVSVRGSTQTKTQFIETTTDPATGKPAALPFKLNMPAATNRPAGVTVNIQLTADGILSVSFDCHDGKGLLTYLAPKAIVGFNAQPSVPANVYLGFIASGGGSNARHQIRNVSVTTTGQSQPAVKTSVLTYHNDNNRTGWNANETTLTTSNVNSASFGLLHSVPLDGRADAQPLVVADQVIDNQGLHDVAYVATENNTLYAIDANSGAILRSRNLGKSIPNTAKDYDDNVYPVYGILSTPVIDRAANAIYFTTDTNEGTSAPDVYRLHKVALNSLADLVPSVILRPGTTLKDGSAYLFPAQHERQRPGLLEAQNTIYVAFGSTGDTQPALSRGIIAGFNAQSLAPLSSNIVTDRLHLLSNRYYLSAIWQSGYGVAGDAQGNVYFSTGNSDSHVPSYDPAFNFPESVLKVSSDLTRIVDSFTQYNYFAQDQGDGDFGSGGTMVLPDQVGGVFPHLLVAGGKDGRAYVLNRDALGGLKPNGPNRDLAELSSGSCWCGPAYFIGADAVPRIVTGGSNGVRAWKIRDDSTLSLSLDSYVGTGLTNGQPDGGGTIPAISSNGTKAGSAIVWFVQRPNESKTFTLNLRAFDAANLSRQLYASAAGNWTNFNSNADVVPTIANGHVYIGSYKQLQIFGLLGH